MKIQSNYIQHSLNQKVTQYNKNFSSQVDPKTQIKPTTHPAPNTQNKKKHKTNLFAKIVLIGLAIGGGIFLVKKMAESNFEVFEDVFMYD